MAAAVRAGVAVDDDDAGHHVLAGRPADPAGDVDLGPVDQAATEVAEAAAEGDPAARQDPDAERALGARVQDGDVVDALLVEQAPELQVDLPRGQVLRRTSRGRARSRRCEAPRRTAPRGRGVVRSRSPTVATITSPS